MGCSKPPPPHAITEISAPKFVSYINNDSNVDDVIEVCKAFDNVCIYLDGIDFDVTEHICNALMNSSNVSICSAISIAEWLHDYAQKHGGINLPNVLNVVPESH